MWQQLHDELSPYGFTVIAVALDPDVAAVREWSAGLTLPVVIDADFVVAEAYGFVNVPASVWIDEDDRIVRPADTAMADDRAVREYLEPPSPELVVARLHRQVALVLRDRGDDEGMIAHLDAAETLAPWDWTIRRGNMPLRGEDPFGPTFFEFSKAFNAAGRPGYFRLRTGMSES